MKIVRKYIEMCNANAFSKQILLLEHEKYKIIPGTNNSYRVDSGNTNTNSTKHLHVYAKRGGNGVELYSININGSGHDGSGGKEIPRVHADFFRSFGYEINANNILEDLNFSSIEREGFQFLLIEDLTDH